MVITVLQSWLETLWIFIKDASLFYWRLLTNKAGLPKWLWIAMLLSWLAIILSMIIRDILT